MKLKRYILLAMMSALFVASDWALAFVPNVQVIMLLVAVIASTFKLWEGALVLLIYVLADNLLGYGLSWYTIPMYVGWVVSLASFRLLFNEGAGKNTLKFASIILGFWYSIPFAITTVAVYGTDLYAYIVADIPFAIVLALSSYVTIDLLYTPLTKTIRRLLNEDLH